MQVMEDDGTVVIRLHEGEDFFTALRAALEEVDLRSGVIPFNVPGVHPHDVAQVLDRSGVCIRAGHHCTMPLHVRLDLSATARASFNVYSTRSDVDALVEGLKEVQRLFGE